MTIIRKRQYSTRESLIRAWHRQRRKAVAKCEELNIQWWEVGKNDEVLYFRPDAYTCIASPNEMQIGETFVEGMDKESIFISTEKYEELWESEVAD